MLMAVHHLLVSIFPLLPSLPGPLPVVAVALADELGALRLQGRRGRDPIESRAWHGGREGSEKKG